MLNVYYLNTQIFLNNPFSHYYISMDEGCFSHKEKLMRHYEIVFLVHPDQSEQVVQMVDRYKELINKYNGKIYRLEDCGRKHLAYPIQKVNKAHYILMNIEADNILLNELTQAFKFNDAVLRSLITVKNEAITEQSIFMKEEKTRSLM